MSRSKDSDSLSKASTLDRFREGSERDFDVDFNEDLDLSYSKFSHVSGVSIYQCSTTESPFVQKIHNKINNIKRQEIPPNESDDVKEPIGNDNFNMYPIPETLHEHNGSNMKSYDDADKLNDDDDDSNSNSNTNNNNNNNNNLNDLYENIENIENIPNPNASPTKIPNSRVRPSSKRVSLVPPDSTPRHKGIRNASVKVSLTPAQRVEKRPGVRLKNALENFQFGEMVGKGAFATVYKGINLKTDQVVAIKQIHLDKDQDVQVLMGEIDLLKILKHSNIVKYHGFVKTSNSLNIFLEFCAGGSLRQLYKRSKSRLPEPQIIKFVKLILNGLHYLHEQGVVHRDVKAANVLITDGDDVKLADFGVAAKVSNQYESVVGTPNWMAPETVLGGEGLCTASDIWSLGATIIELFTTNPPYHDLNPMATLHAIGTDDHPPLPKNISSLAKDFLLECFQKQPSLRTTAKLLLKHKWLNQNPTSSNTGSVPTDLRSQSLNKASSTLFVKSINTYSESNNEENWEGDFEDIRIENDKKQPMTKAEVLTRFSETNNVGNDNNLMFDTRDCGQLLSRLQSQEGSQIEESESDDPFLNIEVDNFDTNELEIQSKMEFLITKFSNRVDYCHNGNVEVADSLIKITGKIAHLVKKYPILHDVLIRDHGILSIFELLENANEFSNMSKLWYYALAILNHIFEANINQFENFCLLGGIPIVTQFRSNAYENAVKQQVTRFINLFLRSDKALSMFISCGGLRVLSKLAEEDFDINPQFCLISVNCIHSILTKDLARSKSDLCRKLSHYGVFFWFIVLLNRIANDKSLKDTVNKIIDIIKYFGQSEVKVRLNISNSDLFKLLMKAYPKLEDNYQLVILKFFKSMSCIQEVLKHLQSSEILEFLASLIKQHPPSSPSYKEYINIISPILYNYCYLNHSKEVELVQLGVVPYLKELSKINLPFRQFILPILCELVHCNKYVRNVLLRQNMVDVYLNLLLDPYWQSNALDSLLNWASHDKHIDLASPKAIGCLTSGFMLGKISNLESSLDNYHKLIAANPTVAGYFINDNIIQNILVKLSRNTKNSVIQLTLLRITRVLVSIAASSDMLKELTSFNDVKDILVKLPSRKNSLLIDELAGDILEFYGSIYRQ